MLYASEEKPPTLLQRIRIATKNNATYQEQVHSPMEDHIVKNNLLFTTNDNALPLL